LSVSGTHFSSGSVRLVDYKRAEDPSATNRLNAIFRSNLPIRDGKFVYYDVVEAFQHAATRDGKFILPTEFYLIVVSLLSPHDSSITKENDFFEDHPELGRVENRPVVGTKENPDDYSMDEIIRKSADLSWLPEDLTGLIEELDGWVNDFSTDQNTIVLVHCEHGKDRTGEVSGAYWIGKGFYSWEQADSTNYEISHGPIQPNNQRSLTWYCHHLQFHQGYDSLTCTHENLKANDHDKPELLGWDQSSQSPWAWILLTLLSLSGVLICLLAVCLSVMFIVVKRSHSKTQDDLDCQHDNLLKKGEEEEPCDVESE